MFPRPALGFAIVLLLGLALACRGRQPTPRPDPAADHTTDPRDIRTPAAALERARLLLRSSDFAASAEVIEASLRPAVGILSTRTTLDALPMGASRFGGVPDVPAGFTWPRYEGQPLTLLAQIQLEDLAGLDPQGRLPASGWISVFYATETWCWTAEPECRSSWAVLFHQGPVVDLHREPAPPDLPPSATALHSASLRFVPAVDLPGSEDRRFPGQAVDPTDDTRLQAWYDLAAALPGPAAHGEIYNHLLGHPQTIQNPMRELAERSTEGMLPPHRQGTEPTDPAYEARVDQWNLLLQLDSDDAGPGWMWGDAGRLYFWIRDEDLKARRFDQTWMELQCY